MATGTPVAHIVDEMNHFFVNFVLYKPEHQHLVLSDAEVLNKVEYHNYPGQLNRIVCELFCIGVIPHLLDGIGRGGRPHCSYSPGLIASEVEVK